MSISPILQHLFSLPLFPSSKYVILGQETISENLEKGKYPPGSDQANVLNKERFWLNYFYFHFCFSPGSGPDYAPAESYFITDYLSHFGYTMDKKIFLNIDIPPVDPRNHVLFVPGLQRDDEVLIRFKTWKDACIYLGNFEADGDKEEFIAEKFFFGILYINSQTAYINEKNVSDLIKTKTNGLIANGLISCVEFLLNEKTRLIIGWRSQEEGPSSKEDQIKVNFSNLKWLFKYNNITRASSYEAKLVCGNTEGKANTQNGGNALMEYLIQTNNIQRIKEIFASGKEKEVFTYYEMSNTHIFKCVYKYNRMIILEAFLSGEIKNNLFLSYLPAFRYEKFIAQMKDAEPLLVEPSKMRKLIEDYQRSFVPPPDDSDDSDAED